ncbi:Metallophosphoesterase [Sulfidibacter corallicola]|uniref:Metallophosphoesterase n=1 Tax=Sulfidibacter corallicola TaxID=2818388 RepID=A0A8A4TXN2_SULCO|nr:metallophosphoesterase [Sulfidibacter corallicola]QTD51285.1 metallophosphoesterase [Sulfidibacter corallicola]
MTKKLLRSSFLLYLFLIPGLLWAFETLQTDGNRRVVTIGDIHGDYDALVSILTTTGLINEAMDWTGGDTILVQTGDLLDRGARVREVLELMMSLEKQAPKMGGRVIVLLGNHETMNLTYFFRDVSSASYAQFTTAESEDKRERAYKAYVKLRRRRDAMMAIKGPRFNKEFKEAWMEHHPLGYLEYLEAIGPEGVYGRWLRQCPAIIQIDGKVFLHAGLNPDIYGSGWSVAEINAKVKEALARFDGYRKAMIDEKLIPASYDLGAILRAAKLHLQRPKRDMRGQPMRLTAGDRAFNEKMETFLKVRTGVLLDSKELLWFRGLAEWREDTHYQSVTNLLAAGGAQHFIAGHTPHPMGISRRFGGRVFLIDTGMLHHYYGGRPSALEIRGDTFTAIYPNETIVLSKGKPDQPPMAIVGDAPVQGTAPKVPTTYQGKEDHQHQNHNESDDGE